MKQFFNISRGEFIATTTLILGILALFWFNIIYKAKSAEPMDLSPYEEMITAFCERQHIYEDSIKRARELRDSAYGHRYVQHARDSPKYSNPFFSRNDIRDTTPVKPFSSVPKYEIIKFDLNSCDTSDLVRVPQFGSKRAQKIIEYRDKLGGFYRLSQIQEVYILQNIDLTLCAKYMYVDSRKIKQISINHATYKELVSHPYFDAYLAKTIRQYCEKNGKISSATDLQKITHAYPELMEQLKPYLNFD